ncbi:MAG: hypothetical protein B7Z20_02455 [Sphingobium sp. 32-64-5]|nr:MAG: hypothetical protein B7Z20_02455 [Sphingobium sp. 32-64-5]
MNLRALFSAIFLFSLWPAAAMAQFSDSYNFLKAVRDKDGAKVTEIISKPGSTIINTRDASTRQTALHIVVERRDAAWLGFLLAKGANPNMTDGQGSTPLMVATRLRFIDGAQILLDNGAQVDRANDGGETPLIRAVQLRDLPLIRLLVGKGANPDKADTLAGMSARDYAIRDGRSQAILDILDTGKPASSSARQGPVQGPVF